MKEMISEDIFEESFFCFFSSDISNKLSAAKKIIQTIFVCLTRKEIAPN